MKKIKVIRQYILWEYLKLTNFYSKLFLYLFSWSILLNNPSKKLKLTTLTLNLHKQILIYEIIWISWTFLLKINTSSIQHWIIKFNPISLKTQISFWKSIRSKQLYSSFYQKHVFWKSFKSKGFNSWWITNLKAKTKQIKQLKSC